MPWWAWLYLVAFALYSAFALWDDVQRREFRVVGRTLLLCGAGIAGTLSHWFATPSVPNARWLALLLLAGIPMLAWDLYETRQDPPKAESDDPHEPSALAVVLITAAVFLPSYIWGVLFVIAAWRGQP